VGLITAKWRAVASTFPHAIRPDADPGRVLLEAALPEFKGPAADTVYASDGRAAKGPGLSEGVRVNRLHDPVHSIVGVTHYTLRIACMRA
jgi:hypothetical protein